MVEGPPPPQVKGKIFDSRFGLIHVKSGGKIFWSRDPPPVKGKNFDTRFGFTHVQTGKKFFLWRDPRLPGIARTCYGYTAGGMPLAFTQEDFLVLNILMWLFTACIRRMTGGYIFTLCVSPHILIGGGSQVLDFFLGGGGGVPQSQ